jgi:hypothetical protein
MFISVKDYISCADLRVDVVYKMIAVEVKGRDQKLLLIIPIRHGYFSVTFLSKDLVMVPSSLKVLLCTKEHAQNAECTFNFKSPLLKTDYYSNVSIVKLSTYVLISVCNII